MKGFSTLCFFIVATVAHAQVKISGTVADAKGEPIPGANIALAATYDGSTTGADGTFSFESDATGKQVLIATFIGYKEFRQELTLGSAPVTVAITLAEAFNELEAVTISAGAFTASDESRRTVFKALDIATTAGATADIASALNTLPGTQKVGESGRLFVRGGDSNEAKTFIDGMVVLDAYGPSAPNTPSRGRFLPFMFKGTSFSTGGYSAEYGQALSSALVLDSKDKAESTRTDIGLLSVGGDVAHTQAWDRGSVAGKVQYTNIRPYYGLINQEIDWITPPASIEGIGAFRHEVGKKGMVKLYGNFNHANYSLYNHAIEDPSLKYAYDLTNDYRYVNGFYKTQLNERWNVRAGLSYTFTRNNTYIVNDHVDETEKGLHAKAVFEGSLSDRVELKTGAEIIHREYNQEFTPVQGNAHTLGFSEPIAALFAEADLYASTAFVTRVGARAEYNALINRFSIDPRISLAYKTGESSQVSFAYGTFRQSPKNELARVDHTLDPEKATHFILNYQHISNNRTFRVETYYKQYRDLVKYIDGNPLLLNNAGNGQAKGVELFWRDNRSLKNVDYWISYSYLDTERDYLDFPHSAVPTFASSHNVSLVYKHFVQPLKTQLGFTYSYTTGRPYNDPNTDYFNAGRTPYYADLSFNAAYLPKSWLILYVSCTNVLGRDNIFGYEYATVPDAHGVYASRAVRQAAPRFLFVGIFITLSKDKSINQLPSL